MGLGMFVGGGRLGQLPGLIINIVVTLRRAINAIGPVQTRIKPLRAVGRDHLVHQHIAHFIVVGRGVFFAIEVPPLPGPIGPGACQTIKDLARAGFPADTCFLRQIGQGRFIGGGFPDEGRNGLFFNFFQPRGHARFAEVFLG